MTSAGGDVLAVGGVPEIVSHAPPNPPAPGISATRGKKSGDKKSRARDNLIDFAEQKQKKLSAIKSSNKRIVATRGNNSRGRKRKSPEESLRIETLKPSKNTWLFRIRWTEADGSRPHFDISRVTDQMFQMIKSDRRNYAAFKNQLIEEFKQGAFRTRHQPGAGTRGVL